MPAPTRMPPPEAWASPHPAVHWATARELREHLRRADETLDPDSSTALAALILLAGLRMEHNVVKLAAFAGVASEFAARCARRLVDNGVWQSGQTVCSWRVDDEHQAAFWADVAVAEGKLCRRLDEQGRPQWAPGGHWWKSFDLGNGNQTEQSVLYHSPPPRPTVAEPLPRPEPEELEEPMPQAGEAAEESIDRTAARPETESLRPETRSPSEAPLPPPLPDTGPEPEPGMTPGNPAPDLFPDAVWL